MTKVQFKHNNAGIKVIVNGQDLGIFETEKDAIYYLYLNDYIKNLYVERN